MNWTLLSTHNKRSTVYTIAPYGEYQYRLGVFQVEKDIFKSLKKLYIHYDLDELFWYVTDVPETRRGRRIRFIDFAAKSENIDSSPIHSDQHICIDSDKSSFIRYTELCYNNADYFCERKAWILKKLYSIPAIAAMRRNVNLDEKPLLAQTEIYLYTTDKLRLFNPLRGKFENKSHAWTYTKGDCCKSGKTLFELQYKLYVDIPPLSLRAISLNELALHNRLDRPA